MEGVAGYFDHEDVPGENEWGAVIKDEEIFATKLVTCIGQQIGIVAAETEAQARYPSPMAIEDVFSMTGRGAGIVGLAERGSEKVGLLLSLWESRLRPRPGVPHDGS